MARKKDGKDTVEESDDNALAEAVRMSVKGRPKSTPRITMGFRCDADLKAEAQRVFGSDVGFILESALRQALKERKKL